LCTDQLEEKTSINVITSVSFVTKSAQNLNFNGIVSRDFEVCVFRYRWIDQTVLPLAERVRFFKVEFSILRVLAEEFPIGAHLGSRSGRSSFHSPGVGVGVVA
jgi:hypothetical protein